MAAAPQRSKPPLHNFSLPPCLKWGNQKFLRCMKLSPNDDDIPQSQSQSSPTHKHNQNQNQNQPHSHSSIQFTYSRSSPTSGKSPTRRKFGDADLETDDGLEVQAVREKLTLDLQVATEKLKVSILDQGVEPARPWNLRTRRAACKAPQQREQHLGSSPATADTSPPPKVSRVQENSVDDQRKKKKRAEFTISLSKEEVEEDFSAMLGKRPPRRPKKRARVVQRQLESLFPGSWLTEVTPELYKVHDVPE